MENNFQLNIEYLPVDQLTPYKNNARKHQREDVGAIVESIKEFGFDDPIGVWGGHNVIVEGHGRLMAAKKLGMERVPVIHLDHLTDEQRRAYALAHNRTAELSEWDEVVKDLELRSIDELDMSQFGFDASVLQEASWFDRQEKDGTERQEGNDEYNEFLDKFEAKKTTDDCYTPDNIYDAVADWVADRYSIDRSVFIRPFYPGGDYKNNRYPEGCAVVDNPPFSIMSEIVRFYQQKGIRFFLFAPSLACFNYIIYEGVTVVGEYSGITYENGANVKTSFLTNMEGPDVAAFSDVTLFEAIEKANDKNEAAMRVSLPKYEYPDEVITSAKMGWLCQYGYALTIRRDESKLIRALDAQKEQGKAIYGCGLLLSTQKTAERAAAERAAAERAAAERAAAERAAAERAAATKWILSDRERGIVNSLGG